MTNSPAMSRLATPPWVAWFQVVVGVSIAALWPFLLLGGEVPEVEAGERGIWFHIGAEIVTSLLLLASGLLSLRGHRGTPLSLVALGALLYTTIASPGYYADSGDWIVVGMFSLLFLATIGATAATLRTTTRTQAGEGLRSRPGFDSVDEAGSH